MLGASGGFHILEGYGEIVGEECIIQECKAISCSNRPQGLRGLKKILRESKNVKCASKVINVALWRQSNTSPESLVAFTPEGLVVEEEQL